MTIKLFTEIVFLFFVGRFKKAILPYIIAAGVVGILLLITGIYLLWRYETAKKRPESEKSMKDQ